MCTQACQIDLRRKIVFVNMVKIKLLHGMGRLKYRKMVKCFHIRPVEPWYVDDLCDRVLVMSGGGGGHDIDSASHWKQIVLSDIKQKKKTF